MTARRANAGLGAVVALTVIATACKPNLDETVSLVTEPTVLAVRVDPPEVDPLASPPTQVTFTALFVGPSGDVHDAPIEWSFCNAREPLADLGPVNDQCLAPSGSWLVAIGTGIGATGAVPQGACNSFGPDVPPVMTGQTPGRPVDPDATGGYYQPTRYVAPAAAGGADVGIAEERIACGLAGATPDQVAEFGAQYHYNANPVVQSLAIVAGGVAGSPLVAAGGGQSNPVPAGQHVTLRVSWPSCPLGDTCGDGVCGPNEAVSTAALANASETSCPALALTACPADCQMPKGCPGAERYLNLDLATQCFVDARESMGVAWFATGGAFDDDRTGRDGSDTTTSSDDGWLAPAQPGTVTLWVVLRDSRGGSDWAEYAMDVR